MNKIQYLELNTDLRRLGGYTRMYDTLKTDGKCKQNKKTS